MTCPANEPRSVSAEGAIKAPQGRERGSASIIHNSLAVVARGGFLRVVIALHLVDDRFGRNIAVWHVSPIHFVLVEIFLVVLGPIQPLDRAVTRRGILPCWD